MFLLARSCVHLCVSIGSALVHKVEIVRGSDSTPQDCYFGSNSEKGLGQHVEENSARKFPSGSGSASDRVLPLLFSHANSKDMQPYLSFNKSNGMNFEIQGHAEPETEEVQAALREPMPLKDTWALHEQAASGRYTTKKIVTFSTAQEFWGVWNGIPQPSELLEWKKLIQENSSGQPPIAIDAIMIFREGIAPEWEHEANANGGHFLLQLRPGTVGGGRPD